MADSQSVPGILVQYVYNC